MQLAGVNAVLGTDDPPLPFQLRDELRHRRGCRHQADAGFTGGDARRIFDDTQEIVLGDGDADGGECLFHQTVHARGARGQRQEKRFFGRYG